MKFRKFGKALLMTAISAGVVFGISSCVQSYSVGYPLCDRNPDRLDHGRRGHQRLQDRPQYGQSDGQSPGFPVSSGGANPGRAVLLTGGRFLYVLNQGTTADGGPCSPTDVCSNANITQFSIGGNGVLAPQRPTTPRDNNPFRMIADSAGAHLFVLDHDAPDSTGCSLGLRPAMHDACGDITAFPDRSHHRAAELRAQFAGHGGQRLAAALLPGSGEPDRLRISRQNYFLTLSGTPAAGDSVFPYAYNAATAS